MSRRRRRQTAFSLFAFQDIITAVTGIMLLITLLLTLELVGRKEKAAQAGMTTSRTPASAADDSENLEQEIAVLRRELADLRSDNALFAKYDDRRLRRELRKRENENSRQRDTLRLITEQLDDAEQRRGEARRGSASQEQDVKTLGRIEARIVTCRKKLEELVKSRRIFMQSAQGSAKTNWLVEISKEGAKAAPIGKTVAPVSFSNARRFQQWLGGRNRVSDHFVLMVKADGISLYGEIAALLKANRFSKGYDVLQRGETVLDDRTGAATP